MAVKIICDSSSIISLADTCLINILEEINAEFIIPQSVKREIIDDPLQTHRFMFNAARIRELVDKGVIKVYPESLKSDAKEFMAMANNIFEHNGKRIKIIQRGEAEAFICLKKTGANILLCDERTMRELIENPESIVETLKERMNIDVKMNENIVEEIKKRATGVKVIRSSELFAYAYEKGLVKPKNAEVLEGGLYALKFSGCAISQKDIEQYKSLFNVGD
ncbi:hypothetical protein DRN74_02920 [Candidatus Micrarchaeota archaeon]|nr:MAG: hypothetical protein DRN74_02920 [Candidatus Micrarchaeota archaeon]